MPAKPRPQPPPLRGWAELQRGRERARSGQGLTPAARAAALPWRRMAPELLLDTNGTDDACTLACDIYSYGGEPGPCVPAGKGPH